MTSSVHNSLTSILPKGSIGDQELALAHADGLGLADIVQTIAQEPASLLVVARDPFLDVVLGRVERLARRIGTHEQQVAHGASFTLSLSTRESNGTKRNRHIRARHRVSPSAGPRRFTPSFPGERDVVVWCRALHIPRRRTQ